MSEIPQAALDEMQELLDDMHEEFDELRKKYKSEKGLDGHFKEEKGIVKKYSKKTTELKKKYGMPEKE